MATYGADRGGRGRSIAGQAAARAARARAEKRPVHFCDPFTGLNICGERVGMRQNRHFLWSTVSCKECLALKGKTDGVS